MRQALRIHVLAIVTIGFLLSACAAVTPASPSPSVKPSVAVTPLPAVQSTATAEPMPTIAEDALTACRSAQQAFADEGPMPSLQDLEAVVTGASPDGGAMLLVAPTPGDPASIWLGACEWRRDGSAVQIVMAQGASASTDVTAGAKLGRGIWDQAMPGDHLLGGPASSDVAAVTVTLADGSTIEATVASGYWLAWWTNGVGSAQIVATDAAGNILSDMPFDDSAR